MDEASSRNTTAAASSSSTTSAASLLSAPNIDELPPTYLPDGVNFPLILAPMVRCSTLPLRTLSLSHSFHLPFSEEIIDKSLLACTLSYNSFLNTYDFSKTRQLKKGKIQSICILRLLPSQPLILQIGTSSPQLSLLSVQPLLPHILGIDVNMGCPKPFSLKGGMGAALLKTPELARGIIMELVKSGKPVSAKVRLLDGENEDVIYNNTLTFINNLVKVGLSLITIHLRTINDSSHESCKKRYWMISKFVDDLNIPVIINGDVWSKQDVQEIKEKGCKGVMVARGGLSGMVKFGETGKGKDELIGDYLRLCLQFDNHFINTKYVVLEMINFRRLTDEGKEILDDTDKSKFTVKQVCGVKDYEGLCGLFGVEYVKEKEEEEEKGVERKYDDKYFLKDEEKKDEKVAKKQKIDA
ncbi:hypothetical protein TrLO_g13109 [Triparma laevis f. longispina]|uniref:DUS-like FMN-binding domain-containing protein n=1 Tax=Triparma laevis f. longispina TaxID=1714387 RepID=A0A9W7FSU3_9STRA|nr:hypothetical protein TrLO_g13109 [Triparma laevis f. longispina]